MNKYLIALLLMFGAALTFAQSQNKNKDKEEEKVKPMFDTEVLRKVLVMDIEGTRYENVEVTLKAFSAELWYEEDRVKITVRDKEGNIIWRKTFKNSYMYIFENGQVQVGKPNFDQLVIYRLSYSKGYTGIIREKEGVY